MVRFNQELEQLVNKCISKLTLLKKEVNPLFLQKNYKLLKLSYEVSFINN